ncbi:MAG: 50S ribosomal protein L24 [Clostridia bacterium]|nr:50S ribosomal protein L24 [Clostridia bacterium]
MNNLHVKKGDTVMINSGADKGKKGKVLEVLPKENKVVVEGVNVRSKHTKPRAAGEPGGILKSEVAINASKANVFCSKCGKGVRTKSEVKKDGTKVRVCSKCGSEIK